MSERPDLSMLLAKWQPTLRLQDWDIAIKYARHFEMGPDRGGEVTRINAKKTGVISILDPADWQPSKIVPQDVEYTVVHELVHLHFAMIDSFKDTEDTLYEQAVHLLAMTLVGLDRKCPDSGQTVNRETEVKFNL